MSTPRPAAGRFIKILWLLGIASLIAYAGRLASGSASGTFTTVPLLLACSAAAITTLGGWIISRGVWRLLLAVAVSAYAFTAALYAIDPAAASKFPSVDDLGLFLFYPCALAAAFAFFQAKVPRLRWVSRLDAAIVAFAFAALGAVVLRPALGDHPNALTYGQLFYALGDLVVLGFLLSAVAFINPRHALSFLLFSLGAAVLALGDCVYVLQVAGDQTEPGILSSLCWPAGLLLFAGSAIVPFKTMDAVRLADARFSLIPRVAAVGYLPIAAFVSHSVNPAADVLTALGLGLVILRLSVSESQNVRLLRRARTEVSERRRSELQLLEAQHLAGVGSWTLDLASNETSWSPQMYAIWGFDPALGAPAADSLLEMVHPDDRAAVEQTLHNALTGADEFRCEYRITRSDGESRTLVARGQLLSDPDRPTGVLLGSTLDVTEQRQRELQLREYAAELESLALSDPLTGLLNHRAFHELLDGELTRAADDHGSFSVVMLDLDGFKLINDRRGHAEGDRVLKSVAAALQAAARPTDSVCRIGGDEFALLLPGCSGKNAVSAAARMARVVRSLQADLDVSFGVAEWPGDGPEKDSLLFRADMELYAAKPARSERKRVAAVSGVAVEISQHRGKKPEDASTARDDASQVAIGRLLDVARDQLGMEIAYSSEFTHGEQVFRALSGDTTSFGLEKGTGIPLEQTYCQRMVAGELPSVIPDTGAEERVNRLPATKEADIGAYIGVPVRFSDGKLYGTLCCASHHPNRSLGQRDVAFMNVLARLIADQLERDSLESKNRRLASQASAARVLLAALDARDRYTSEHSTCVIELAERVAKNMALEPDGVAEVQQLALLHDIGKLGIPDEILHKPSKLNPAEWQMMQEHPDVGARIVESIPELAHLAPLIRAEHERWDGGGYPAGLAGNDIPLPSRIVFACEAWHAMTSDRPYRAAMTPEEARRELQRNAGTQFDPIVVSALTEVLARHAHDAVNVGVTGP